MKRIPRKLKKSIKNSTTSDLVKSLRLILAKQSKEEIMEKWKSGDYLDNPENNGIKVGDFINNLKQFK